MFHLMAILLRTLGMIQEINKDLDKQPITWKMPYMTIYSEGTQQRPFIFDCVKYIYTKYLEKRIFDISFFG